MAWRVLRSLRPLLVSAAAAAALTLLARAYLRYDGIETDLGSWNSLFAVFGVVYAIIVGFLLLIVLGRYSSIAQVCEEELNAVECLRDFLVYFEDRAEAGPQRVRAALAAYARSVAEREWEEMSRDRPALDSDTSEELYAVMRACKDLEISRPIEEPALASMLDVLAELTRIRTRRIALGAERLPPRLRLLLAFMSCGLVLGFAALGVVHAAVHVGMTVAVALSVHLLHLIISDLDHPFHGVWNVDRTALDALTARLDAGAAGNS